MSINNALNNGLSGLSASQSALQVISNNIANATTANYTRKIIRQTCDVVAGQGTGVATATYTRIIDSTLSQTLRAENSSLAYYKTISDAYDILQNQLGSLDEDSTLSNALTDLETAFEALTTGTSKSVDTATAIEAATSFFNKLNALSDKIQSQRLAADQEINEDIKIVQDCLDRIESLNAQIVKVKAGGITSTADLEDLRDAAIKEISTYIDIDYYENATGAMNIYTKSGIFLLGNEALDITHEAAGAMSAYNTYDGGGIDGINVNGFDITGYISNGEIAGLIELRDSILPSLQAEIDELASSLKQELNSVHNQGISYPDLNYDITGTRTFIDPSQQSISINSGEVRIVILNNDGSQKATTTLSGLGFTSGTMSELAGIIQNWLQADVNGAGLTNASVGFDSQGKMTIDLGTSEYGIGFRDEVSSLPGAEQTNAAISFDADGIGVGGESQIYSGFSSFLGLNDLLVNNSKDWMYDSNVVSKNFKPLISAASPATLHFSDEDNGINYTSITLYAGESIQDLANKINTSEDLKGKISAEIIKDGNGYRLRIINQDSQEQMEITESGSNNILSQLGLSSSDCGLATTIGINNNIAVNPNLMSTGTVEYNIVSGSYSIGENSNSISIKMAGLFSKELSFKSAGNITKGNYSLSNYASLLISKMSVSASNSSADYEYQSELVTTLETKYANVSGVNLDEELSNLILYQQSYTASAKVISTASDMLDILMNIFR